MTRIGRLLCMEVTAIGVLAWATGSAGEVTEENLAPIRTLPRVSWVEHDWGYTVRDGVLKLVGGEKGPASYQLASPWFPRYVAAQDVIVRFSCRGDAKSPYVLMNTRAMERCGEGKANYQERHFQPTAEWKLVEIRLPFPQTDAWGYDFCLRVGKGAGTLEVRDLEVAEATPADAASGRPLRIGGAAATEIAVLATDDERRHAQEMVAARQFRYMLRKAGGAYLPIRTAKDISEIGAAAVLVGAAAEKAGLIAPEAVAKYAKGLTGGCAYAAKGTRLGVSGAIPAGIPFGVFKFFSAIGVEYLGESCWRTPAGAAFEAAEGLTATHLPALAINNDHGNRRIGTMPEMRGYSPFGTDVAEFTVGARSGHVGPDHSMARSLVTMAEFRDSHPEFFAVQRDGRPQPKDTSEWAVQFCLSQPGLAELMGRRMVEVMRATPHATFYFVSPGDGGNSYCRCAACASRPMSDTWIAFANRVAEITSKEFPDRFLLIYSYVDTAMPPSPGVKPHPNVIASYCIYPSSYWPSEMIYRHPMNRKGFAALKGWREAFPNLALTYYPMQCGEWMHLWPGYKCDVDVMRDFAGHGAVQVRYFGMWPTHGIYIPQAGAFADLRIYVMERLREDPSCDDRAGARAFIRDFYGKAAPMMQAYFDRIVEEPERRDWVQYCEQHIKGFVTKECAADCLPLLDAAEAAAGSPAERERVLHEKIPFLWTYLTDICRGRGNVSSAEFPAWAKRVGEFCRICKETKIAHMGGAQARPKDWFYALAFLKIGEHEHWYDDPVVEAIVRDPEKGLGADLPNLAERTADGILIPARGMGGGFFTRDGYWKSEVNHDSRCIRRLTSGLGLVFTTLDLAESPSGEVTMYVKGIDNEKPDAALGRFKVNGRTVFEGKVPFAKDAWSETAVKLPAGTLVRGRNDIQFENITPDAEAASDGEGGDRFRAPRNYFWGWYSIWHVRFAGVK